MARYFFNVTNGKVITYPHCVDLPNIRAARREAVRLACTTLGENPDEFWHSGEWQVTVTDERGLNLLSVLLLATNAPICERL